MFAEDFEEEMSVECDICGGDIIIDSYADEDDIVYCNDCEAEYLLESLSPLRLQYLDDEDFDADLESEEDFD